jgi:hypothetical protein
VPADRFFGTASEVLRTLKERVAANALELARHGRPSNPFYLTGQMGGQPFSVHAEGERVILTGAAGRQEVDLVPPAPPETDTAWPEPVCPAGVVQAPEGWLDPPEPALGASPLDDGLQALGEAGELDEAFDDGPGGDA